MSGKVDTTDGEKKDALLVMNKDQQIAELKSEITRLQELVVKKEEESDRVRAQYQQYLDKLSSNALKISLHASDTRALLEKAQKTLKKARLR